MDFGRFNVTKDHILARVFKILAIFNDCGPNITQIDNLNKFTLDCVFTGHILIYLRKLRRSMRAVA